MTIKTKAYIDNLKQYLGVTDLNQINDTHSEKISQYLDKNQSSDVFKEILKSLPDLIPVVTASIKMMEDTYTKIIESGNYDINTIKEIIISLNKLIEKDNLTEKDKDRIFELMSQYKQTLDEQLERNHELKKYILGGSTFVAVALVFFVYKAAGGKGGEEIVQNVISKA